MRYTHEYRERIMKHHYNNGILTMFFMAESFKGIGLDFMMCMEYTTNKLCFAIGDSKFAIMGQDIRDHNYKISEMPLRIYYGGEHLELIRRAAEFCAFNFLQMYEKEDELHTTGLTPEEIIKQIDDLCNDDVYIRRMQMVGKRKTGVSYSKYRKKQNSNRAISDM